MFSQTARDITLASIAPGGVPAAGAIDRGVRVAMDFAKARRNMVESQLRTNRVIEPAIVTAMGSVPRERFLPDALAAVAYIDEDLPLGGGRFLMEPMIFGRMLQEAMPGPEDAVLLIGCGTGYSAAVLAKLCSAVIALERDSGAAAKAQALLSGHGADNVVVVEGPLEKGWPDEAPYQLVLFDGAVDEVPQAIIDQLAENGRIVAVISNGEGPGRATLIERRGGVVSRRTLFDANTPVLPEFVKSTGFVF